MATQPGIVKLNVFAYPNGVDNTQRSQELTGQVTLGSPGEPISITAWAISGNIATFTATNTLIAGQTVQLTGFGTSTFFNGRNVVVLPTGLTGSAFTAFFQQAPGSATEAGKASPVTPLNIAITAWSITSNVVTFTAANTLAAGQTVTLSGFGTSTFFNGVQAVVSGTGLSGTSFRIPLTHGNGSGTEAGVANLSPFYVTGGLGINWFPMTSLTTGGTFIADTSATTPSNATFESQGTTGYVYRWNRTSNTLQIYQGAGATPAGTISAPTITTATGDPSTAPIGVVGGALAQTAGAAGITGVQAPVFTGTAQAAAALSEFPDATALPQAIINDLIVFVAKFPKGY